LYLAFGVDLLARKKDDHLIGFANWEWDGGVNDG
jgi:hypothetical protein